MFMSYAISGSAIARSWSGYFGSLLRSFGLDVSSWIPILTPGRAVEIDWIAPIIILLLTYVTFRGVKDSTKFSNVITILNLVNILLIVLFMFIDNGWNLLL